MRTRKFHEFVFNNSGKGNCCNCRHCGTWIQNYPSGKSKRWISCDALAVKTNQRAKTRRLDRTNFTSKPCRDWEVQNG